MKESDAISKNNFKFNKKFGQNFIFDKNLLEAIINDSKISKQDDVLEIGAGAGTLTKIIASHAKRVISYEIDENLKPVLAENLNGVQNSTVIFADALKTPIEQIESNFEGNYSIVANLPYYITTPLIFKFLKQTNKVQKICIMVQKEVGERLVAKGGSSEYGTISVMIDFYGDAKVVRQVPRRMFVPSPNVDSCIVVINIVPNKFNANKDIFEKVVKSAFSNRRKTLVNNLSKDFNISKQQVEQLLLELGLPITVRGDSLNTKQFVDICQKLTK